MFTARILALCLSISPWFRVSRHVSVCFHILKGSSVIATRDDRNKSLALISRQVFFVSIYQTKPNRQENMSRVRSLPSVQGYPWPEAGSYLSVHVLDVDSRIHYRSQVVASGRLDRRVCVVRRGGRDSRPGGSIQSRTRMSRLEFLDREHSDRSRVFDF